VCHPTLAQADPTKSIYWQMMVQVSALVPISELDANPTLTQDVNRGLD
jgi:hypothetical protein